MSNDPLPCGDLCEAFQKTDRRVSDIDDRLAHLENELHLVAGRLRTLTYVIVGGMILDLFVNSSKASAFFGR